MQSTELDAIIDDSFLEQATWTVVRKYEGKTNTRASQIISKILEQKQGN